MTIRNDPHLSGLMHALASFIKSVRRQRLDVRPTKPQNVPPKVKPRSHRASSFFELP